MLNQADLGKRVSVRRKMSRAAMDNEVLQSVVFPEKQMLLPRENHDIPGV